MATTMRPINASTTVLVRMRRRAVRSAIRLVDLPIGLVDPFADSITHNDRAERVFEPFAKFQRDLGWRSLHSAIGGGCCLLEFSEPKPRWPLH